MEAPDLNQLKNHLNEFCERWLITEFAVFGSILGEDFRPESNVDLLVTFAPEAHWTLLDFAAMEEELSAILGREVDLVMREAVEASRNPRRRQSILQSAQVVYAA